VLTDVLRTAHIALMTPMRVVLVDDEPLALRRLRSMLTDHDDVEIVAECEDASVAVDAVRTAKPDVVFLDVRMPEVDGFQLLKELKATPPPVLIFVTAHAEHAVRAFDADAADYLLKPFDRARLAKALDRARGALAVGRDGALGDDLREVLASLRGRSKYLDRIAVPIGRRTIFVKTATVDWIEADGNYLHLHVGRQRYVIRSGLGILEGQLDPAQFARVHRSAIVNLDRVQELRTVAPGEYRIVLTDGTELAVSRGYRDRLPR
jgi:two-component system LytT family response regulator